MNREALLVYLHDLRDLEVAKYQIEKMKKSNYTVFQSEISVLDNKERYKDMPRKDYVDILIVGVLGLIIVIFSYIWLPQMGDVGYNISLLCEEILEEMCGKFSPIFVPWLIITDIILIVYALSRYLLYKKKYRETEKYNKEEEYRISNEKNKLRNITDKYNSKGRQLQKELQKVNALLQDAYSLNILAGVYRNLPSVYYIYEYMSTSQASLEETFMHAHMENGFQRIEKKLDIIIKQNEEIIFTTRQIEANTARTVKQTTEMLNSLQRSLELQQRTEQNTLEAAQYAGICATYSKTTAFFSVANYFSNRKVR